MRTNFNRAAYNAQNQPFASRFKRVWPDSAEQKKAGPVVPEPAVKVLSDLTVLPFGRLSLEFSLTRLHWRHIRVALNTLPPLLAEDSPGKLLLIGLTSQGLVLLPHFSEPDALLRCHYL